MGTSNIDFFSNLYIHYYYGSYTKCGGSWKEYHASCPFAKLYYIKKGECELVIEGKIFHGVPGMLFLIPAHTQHSYYHINTNYIEKYWMHFELKTGDDQALKSLGLPYFVTVPKEEALDGLFSEIISLSRQMDLASRMLEKANILKLVSAYILFAQKEGYHALLEGHTSPEKDIHRVIEYMNSHLASKITVAELAGLLHIHPNYFIRLFKSHMGVPPLNYVSRLRIERAKSLLENTDLPVSHIMQQTGFDEISTFSRFFKHYTGYNPRQFRKTFSSKKNALESACLP